jgi:hypothetical protein
MGLGRRGLSSSLAVACPKACPTADLPEVSSSSPQGEDWKPLLATMVGLSSPCVSRRPCPQSRMYDPESVQNPIDVILASKCHRTRSGPFGSETAQGSMGRTFSRSDSGFEGGGMSESGEGTLLESTRYTRQQSAAQWKRCTDARSCRLPSQCTSSAFSLVVLSSRSPPPPVAVTVGSGRGGVKGRWTYWRRALRVVTEKVGAGAGISSRIRA